MRKAFERQQRLDRAVANQVPLNALQSGNGLERCCDRSERGFSRYIQLGALGRNLHVPGKILLARDDAQCKAAQSRRKTMAA